MEQAYAQALMNLVEGGMSPKQAVHALIESLKVHGREALLPHIVRAFERLAEREMRKNAVVVSVAHEKDIRKAKTEARAALAKLRLDSDDVQAVVDESLIGGWRLEGKGILFDNSFKKSLLEMYNAATS